MWSMDNFDLPLSEGTFLGLRNVAVYEKVVQFGQLMWPNSW